MVAGFGGGHARGRPPRSRTGNRRRLQIRARRLAANAGRFLDAPQRPAQSPQRQDLLLFVVLQDVAHPDVGNTRSPAAVNVSAATRGGRFSGVHQWPVLGVHRGSKVSQVAGANVKGVLASTAPFQEGALRFAESKGFAVLRHNGGADFKLGTEAVGVVVRFGG